jgi:hypothetical protein
MKTYYEELVEKYTRQRNFKREQSDFIAVELLERKIAETLFIIEEKKAEKKELARVKSERDYKIRHLSDRPKFAFIHKVVDLNKLVGNILREHEKARTNDHVLFLKVWAMQNPNLREVYTSFTDFAEALIEGYYVPVNDILKAKEDLITVNN